MNFSTLLGLGLGLVTVGLVIGLTSTNISGWFDGLSFLVVIGGTLSATLVAYPMSEVLRVLRSLRRAMREERLDPHREIDELVELSTYWFRGDMREVERRVQNSRNGFLRTGVQLLVDKTPVEDVMSLLQWRIARLKAKEKAEAQVFRSMAGFAPAFGMLGTLLGLINLMQVMDAGNITQIATNMALALITTFYGLLLANLFFRPIATKLERATEQRVMLMSMIMEGISLLSDRRGPAVLRETLYSFVQHFDNELDTPPPPMADMIDRGTAQLLRNRVRQPGES